MLENTVNRCMAFGSKPDDADHFWNLGDSVGCLSVLRAYTTHYQPSCVRAEPAI